LALWLPRCHISGREASTEPLTPPLEFITILLKAFYVRWAAPLQYFGSYRIGRADTGVAGGRIGVSIGTELIVYKKNVAGSVRRLNLTTSVIWNGDALIFEVPPDAPLPTRTHARAADRATAG
jgi:hypothetical protein